MEKPPEPPDVDDQEIGADEEDDERLDHRRQVGGERGLEDLGVEVPRRGSDAQPREQQAGEEDADGLVPPEERDGDRREGDEVRVEVALVDRVLDAEEVDGSGEPCEGAGDGEREEVVLPHADAAVTCRLRVEADRTDLVPERRAVEQERSR